MLALPRQGFRTRACGRQMKRRGGKGKCCVVNYNGCWQASCYEGKGMLNSSPFGCSYLYHTRLHCRFETIAACWLAQLRPPP
jgi:hypothetical protein